MAKLETLTYVISVDAIKASMLTFIKDMEPTAVLGLADEIKSGALLQACAWLSSGGIWQWRTQAPEACIKMLYLNIMELVNGFNANTRPPANFAGGCWAISVETWALANAVFAYGIADNILRHTSGLHETINRFGDDVIFFTPQRVYQSANKDTFIFQVGLFNRDLLRAG